MSVLDEAIELAAEWVPRVVRMLPVFRDLWDGVKEQDQAKIFAAQMEMQRRMREQQAREEFLKNLDDEPTNPGA